MAFLIGSSAVIADLAVSFYKTEIKDNAVNADYYFDHLVAATVLYNTLTNLEPGCWKVVKFHPVRNFKLNSFI